jgi:hypothetical protein
MSAPEKRCFVLLHEWGAGHPIQPPFCHRERFIKIARSRNSRQPDGAATATFLSQENPLRACTCRKLKREPSLSPAGLNWRRSTSSPGSGRTRPVNVRPGLKRPLPEVAITSSEIFPLLDFAVCVKAARRFLVTYGPAATGFLPSVESGLSPDGGRYALKEVRHRLNLCAQ